MALYRLFQPRVVFCDVGGEWNKCDVALCWGLAIAKRESLEEDSKQPTPFYDSADHYRLSRYSGRYLTSVHNVKMIGKCCNGVLYLSFIASGILASQGCLYCTQHLISYLEFISFIEAA